MPLVLEGLSIPAKSIRPKDTFSAPPLTTNSNPGKLHSYCLLLATSQLSHVFASSYPETKWFLSHVRWIRPHHCTFTWKWMTRFRLFPSHVWEDFAFLPALPECDSIPISTWTSFAAVVSTYKPNTVAKWQMADVHCYLWSIQTGYKAMDEFWFS